MAREIIVRTWCDLHLVEGEHVEGDELPPLALGRGKPRVLALCEVHRKEIYQPLLDALDELGQPVDDAGRSAARPTRSGRRGGSLPHGGEHQCPVDGCDYSGPTRGALSKHTRAQHDASLTELEHDQTETDLLTCPECGRRFAAAKGLGAHRSKAHGVVGGSSSARRARAKKAGSQ